MGAQHDGTHLGIAGEALHHLPVLDGEGAAELAAAGK